jgi:4-oxalocrotonate tautomerase
LDESRGIRASKSLFTSGVAMPFIQVKLINEVFSAEQKRKIITKLTDAMVSIEGEHMRPVTWVVIEEVKGGQWGIGGQPLTAADVKAMAGS